jgi:hypothetical protein
MDSRDIGIMSDWGHSTIVQLYYDGQKMFEDTKWVVRRYQMGSLKPLMEDKTDNRMTKEKGQTLHRELMIEQYEPH